MAQAPAPRGPRRDNGWVELAHSAGRLARSRWGARIITGIVTVWLIHTFWALICAAVGEAVTLLILLGIIGIAVRGLGFKGKSH